MNVNINDLKQNRYGVDYETGYRIVYFYDNGYKVGEYCKTIEGFMIGFADCDPIIDEDDIPKFVSTQDLLNRYLSSVKGALCVAIYDINGTCIDKIYRQDTKKNEDFGLRPNY